MSRQIPGDISVWTVGGAALLDYIKDVTYTLSGEAVEGRSIAYLGRSARITKKSVEIRTGVMSASANTYMDRITNLDVSGLSLGGTEYKTMLRGGSFNLDYSLAEGSGVGDMWKFPYCVAKDYSAEVDVMLPLATGANLSRDIGLKMHDATIDDMALTFSLTINSVAYTLPMVLVKLEERYSDNDLVILKLSLKGRGPNSDSGYPTAPAGSTTLLEKAFNAPQTALAFTFTPHPNVGYGVTYGGNVVFGSVGFSFNDAQIIDLQYTFHSQGTVTQTNT